MNMNPAIPQNNVVNANIGITNIIEKEEIRNTMMKTFIELADKLKAHCGPYSGTAILTDPDNALAEPIFTKDGINIVKSIKYASPMQDFVRRQLAYMGSRIERSAGDGTTSSMIIMAYTLASLLDIFNTTRYIYTNIDLQKVWNTLVENMIAKYKDYVTLTTNLEDRDTIRYIAASQAYTSSHGDKELAKCIGELFYNTPKEVWDTLTIKKAVYESEDKYKVEVVDSEYILDNVRMFPNNKCNEELGTVLYWKDVDVYIHNVVAIGDDYQKDFNELLKTRIESGEKTIVICDDSMDSATIEYYQGLFTTNPNHNTVFILSHSEDANLNDINAISVILYPRWKDSDSSTTPPFKGEVRFQGSSFNIINGLYDIGKPETGLSPYYNNNAYPDFNEFVNQIRIIIAKENADVTRKNDNVIKTFTRILHKLLTTRFVNFIVGGAAYDNAAAQDIAMDALLATKCSLIKGAASGRCVSMKAILEDFLDKPTPMTNSKYAFLYNAYVKSLIAGVTEVDNALADSVGKSDNIDKALEYTDSPADFTRLDDPSYVVPTSLQQAIKDKTDYCILQPVETDITFLKRFGELGLKFLTANRVITSGYLYER